MEELGNSSTMASGKSACDVTARAKSANKGETMRLYLFGPMRGYKLANAPAFKEAREKLRDMGHDVFCPSEVTEELKSARPSHAPDLRELLSIDLNWICRYAEGLVGLPGWASSKGSLAEVHLAWAIGIPVYEYELFVRRVIREVKNVPNSG